MESSDPMNFYRKDYTEEDIEVLVANPRFVVAVDAFRMGCCGMEQMMHLAFTAPPYLPRNLTIRAFGKLVLEVKRRLATNELKIPEEWKREYSTFYIEQPDDPLVEQPVTPRKPT